MKGTAVPETKTPPTQGRPSRHPKNGAIGCLGVDAGYGQLSVLRDVSITVQPGEVVALLGANGAGKSTTVLTLAGEIKPSAGDVYFGGSPTTRPLHQRSRKGLRLITEDRAVLMSLSVADNLKLIHASLDEPLALFPELEPLLRRRVGLLSGGEQQILTLARALTGASSVLLADELSLGLAPLIVERLLKAVRDAADRGMAVLLVEQQIRNAFSVADHVYVLQRGRVVLEGSADDLRARMAEVRAAYLTDADPSHHEPSGDLT